LPPACSPRRPQHGQPAAGPGSCFRSDAFDRARARFATQTQRGDWGPAIADAQQAQRRPPRELALRALYALQHAQAAQQRSSYAQADPAGVAALLQEAAEPVRVAGDACLINDLQFLRAEIHYSQAFDGEVTWDQVRGELDAVLRGLEPLRDEDRLAKALFYRGLIDQQQAVGDLGQRFFDRAREIAERRGDDYRLSYIERHLAGIADTRGDLSGAEAGFRRSLALREKVGALLFIPPAQTALADLLLKRAPRDPDIARLYADAAARAVAAKANRLAASAHAAISRRLAAAGDREAARRHAETALTFAQAHGATWLVAGAREALDRLRADR
jgi:hypothetical protein